MFTNRYTSIYTYVLAQLMNAARINVQHSVISHKTYTYICMYVHTRIYEIYGLPISLENCKSLKALKYALPMGGRW